MSKFDYKRTTLVSLFACVKAGKRIMEVYSGEFGVELKSDNSPITLADKRSNETITDILTEHFSEIPVLSEEGREIPYLERKDWEYLWVVDPLDGTKEFVSRNGEFAINIALVRNGEPIFGVLYSPVNDFAVFGGIESSVYKIEDLSRVSSIIVAGNSGKNFDRTIEGAKLLPVLESNPSKNGVVGIIASRSHYNEETKKFVDGLKKQYGKVELKNIGSALKFCMLAENEAQIYPRFGPCWEWDTAAGHAILKGVNGDIVDSMTRKSLTYNKENLLNPHFIAGNAEVVKTIG